jgi:lipid II:glycine glycyltransferase (peptidoglycan interpeptide bridge formation enzyme)
MASPDFEVEWSFSVNNNTNEIIAGALFIKTDNIVQYHLSGIKEEFLYINLFKLVIDSMRVKSTEAGYTYFNLGGVERTSKIFV